MIKQVLILLLLGALQAQNTTIAVFDLENNGLKESEVRILSDRLQSELVKVGGYTVVERKKIEKVFEEQKFQMSGCVEECLIEVGKLLGATEIVIGSVGRLGLTYTVSVRLVNATSGEMIRSSDYDTEGSLNELLKFGMYLVANELTGKLTPQQVSANEFRDQNSKRPTKGSLKVYSTPSNARVTIAKLKKVTISDIFGFF